jgi:hypothetical protein
MRRFFALTGAVTAAALWVVGCSSDSSSSGTSAGGSSTGGSSSGGSGGSSSDAKCSAPQYTDITVSDFLSQADASKACGSSTDATNVCDNDVSTAGATCGKSCLLMGGDDAAQASCVATCISQSLPSSATPFSDGCLSCYTADVQCARKQCFAQCATAPTSDGCLQCRIDMGCTSTFYDCSGLLVPTGLDLGAGASAGAGGA